MGRRRQRRTPLKHLAAVLDPGMAAAAHVVQLDTIVAAALAGLDTPVGERGLCQPGGAVVKGAIARAGGGAATMPVNRHAASHDVRGCQRVW